MIILGIDPGLRTTGFGVIQKHGSKLRYIASGTIKSGEGDLPTRLKVILGVGEVARTQPGLRRHRTSVRQRQPAIDPAAGPGARRGDLRAGVGRPERGRVFPTQIKQAVVGTGRAVKAQMQEMVARLLSMPACRAPMRPTHWASPSATRTAAKR
jgi:crossover junction endodeoxyribonuclease RuvC